MAASAGPTELSALAAFGDDVGVAFQIADDVLDATATSETLGKTAGRDLALNKSTYAQVLGVDGARAEAGRLAERALGHLAGSGCATASLAVLADYIVTRSS
jgi:farnesyl diphosphate synthase